MHTRLKRARIEAGYKTASQAIAAMGWKGSTYRAHENGQNNFDTEFASLYGQAYGVDPAWLLLGDGGDNLTAQEFSDAGCRNHIKHVKVGVIYVAGLISAGVWVEQHVVKRRQGKKEISPFPPDPTYPLVAQYDFRVEGDSLDRFAQAGDMLRCVDIKLAQIEVNDGDLVIIERRRNGLIETSARRVRRLGNRYEFWFESNDPLWNTVVMVKDQTEGKGDDIQIVAKVLWRYSKA